MIFLAEKLTLENWENITTNTAHRYNAIPAIRTALANVVKLYNYSMDIKS